MKGFEPSTFCLASRRSTPELHQHFLVDRMGIEPIDSDLARITRNPITQPEFITTLYISLQYSARDTLRCLVSSPSRFEDLLHSSLTCAFTPSVRVTTKAISRIGGRGRNFSWRICSDLYTPTRTQTSGVSWRRAGILEIQTGISRSHRFQGESSAPVWFTLRILVRVEGLEPPRLKPPDPKSGASTNFAIPAY